MESISQHFSYQSIKKEITFQLLAEIHIFWIFSGVDEIYLHILQLTEGCQVSQAYWFCDLLSSQTIDIYRMSVILTKVYSFVILLLLPASLVWYSLHIEIQFRHFLVRDQIFLYQEQSKPIDTVCRHIHSSMLVINNAQTLSLQYLLVSHVQHCTDCTWRLYRGSCN